MYSMYSGPTCFRITLRTQSLSLMNTTPDACYVTRPASIKQTWPPAAVRLTCWTAALNPTESATRTVQAYAMDSRYGKCKVCLSLSLSLAKTIFKTEDLQKAPINIYKFELSGLHIRPFLMYPIIFSKVSEFYQWVIQTDVKLSWTPWFVW